MSTKSPKALKMASQHAKFVTACERANEALENRPGYRKVLPTSRQFRKYQRHFGSAYEFGRILELVD